jgi:hypothetical protein
MYIYMHIHIYIYMYENITEENEYDMNNDDYSEIGNNMCTYIYIYMSVWKYLYLCKHMYVFIYT